MTQIAELKNLGPASAAMLGEVGIHSLDELRSQDAVTTYILLKAFGFRVNNNMLWALHGALNDTDWREIQQSTKDMLVAKVDEYEN